MNWYRWDGADLLLELKVQPRAASEEIVGLHAERLKVRIRAPASEGRANATLCDLIARTFAVPRSRVSVVRGAASREKQLRITGPVRTPAPTYAHVRSKNRTPRGVSPVHRRCHARYAKG